MALAAMILAPDIPFDSLGAVERAATALARLEVASEPGGPAFIESLVRRQVVLSLGGGEDAARTLLLSDLSAPSRPLRALHDTLSQKLEAQPSVEDILSSVPDGALPAGVVESLTSAISLEHHQPALVRAAIAYGCIAATPPVSRESLGAATLISDLILVGGGLMRRSRVSPVQLDAATRSAAVQVERSGAWLEWIRAWCMLLAREASVVERAVRGALTELAAQRAVARGQHRIGATDEMVLAQLQSASTFTIKAAVESLGLTAPTVGTAIERLEAVGVATELTGQKRDRIWVSTTLLRLSTGG